MKLNYYLNPNDVVDYNERKWRDLDKKAETSYIHQLQADCQLEMRTQNRMMEEAQGWFFPDVEKMTRARNMAMKSCRRLQDLDNLSY